MTYGQPAARTRYDFEAVAQITANLRRAERKRLRRLRAIKRALHFLCFLSYWAIVLGIGYLLSLAVMILFIYLS
jgi:hypothetical protein